MQRFAMLAIYHVKLFYRGAELRVENVLNP